MRLIDTLIRLPASRPFTLILMAVSAVAMAVITFYEAADLDDTKPYYLYFSWWFSCLLILVWANLLLQMIRTSWWRWKRLPLTSVHTGFLLILTGAFLTHAFGLDGRIRISEGETRGVFQVKEPVLTAVFDNEGEIDRQSFLIDAEGKFGSRSLLRLANPFVDKKSIELENGLTVAIIDEIESSRTVEEMADDPSGRGPPALTVEIESQGPRRVTLQNWQKLTLRGQALSQIVYTHAAKEEEIPSIVESVFGEYIEIAPEAKPHIRIPVSLPRDLDREIAAEGYTIRIVEYHPDFTVGEEPDQNDPPRNPAVRLKVDGPSDSRTFITFAFFPHPGNTLEDGTTFRYCRAETGRTALLVSGKGEQVELFTSLDGDSRSLARDEKAAFDEEGAPVTVKWLAFQPSVEVIRRLERDPDGKGPPAYLVRLGDDGDPALLSAESGVVFSKDGRAKAYVSHTFDLGFDLVLDDAVAKYWPGSRIARAYYSLARIPSSDKDDSQSVRIETNAPLLRNGFRLYQTSMDPQPPYRWSEFDVARDPGLPLVTAGFLIMSAGFLWFFSIKFVVRPIRARRKGTS